MNSIGLILSDDLLLSSQITGYARDRGGQVRIVRDPAKLLALALEQLPQCVWIDLQVAGADGASLIRSLRGQSNPPLIIGFGSHVRQDVLQTAQDAGCDIVLPRSALAAQLPTRIDDWLKGRAGITEPS
jgi:DNA-binding response OmpR family regulator